jgi:hypothetical protein
MFDVTCYDDEVCAELARRNQRARLEAEYGIDWHEYCQEWEEYQDENLSQYDKLGALADLI